MEQTLKEMVAEHGIKAVYETLQHIMREDYEVLQKLLGTQKPVLKEKKTVPQQPPNTPVLTAISSPQEEQKEETISTLVHKAGRAATISFNKMEAPPSNSNEQPKKSNAGKKKLNK